jgi:hypothetical protein
VSLRSTRSPPNKLEEERLPSLKFRSCSALSSLILWAARFLAASNRSLVVKVAAEVGISNGFSDFDFVVAFPSTVVGAQGIEELWKGRLEARRSDDMRGQRLTAVAEGV